MVQDLLGTLPREFSNLKDVIAQSNANPRYVPRILFDGADSIGAWGALARVYLNIGTYHEQWDPPARAACRFPLANGQHARRPGAAPHAVAIPNQRLP